VYLYKWSNFFAFNSTAKSYEFAHEVAF
jgi:hypothetical protein